MKQYGKAIKTLRRNAEMTQAQLAQKLNVSAQTVSKWENEVNLPDIFVIEEICSLFGIAMEEFIKLAENGVQNPAEQARQEVAQANEAPEVYSAPAAGAYAATAAPAAPVRTRDKRLWIVIVAAVIGSIIALTSLIAPLIVLLTNYFGKDVYEKVNPSVFCITVQTYNNTMGGSGFFIDKDGTAVTNYHVIEGIKSAKVKLYDGKEYDVDKIIGHDTVRDIAVIHVGIKKSIPVSFADSNKIKTGDKVYAIGYPQSFVLGSQDSTMTDGIISKTSYSVDGVNYIQSNVDITNGNSGGVLVNEKGQVIGMTSKVLSLANITYMNLSVPSNTIKSVKKDINLSVKDYAEKYSKKITITYLLDGKQYTEKCIYAAGNVPDVDVITAALGPEYADCEFLGWFSDDKFTIPFDFTATADKDLTLYAKIRFNKYTVAFDGGSGATGYVQSETLNADEDLTLPENGFTRTGYKFAGWKYDGQIYNAGDTITAGGSKAVLNVEAEWQGVAYSVKFVYDWQKIEYSFRYGEQHRTPAISFTRKGYSQTGWDCNGTVYALGANIPDLTTTENETVICEPVWDPVKYKMRLDFGRYTEFMGEDYNYHQYAYITCTYGEHPFDDYDDPEACGLVFEGWTVYSADGKVYEGDLRYVNSDPNVTIRAKANWVSGRYLLVLYKSKYDSSDNCLNAVILEGREEYLLPPYSSFDDEGYSAGYHFVCWEFYNSDKTEEEVTFKDGAQVSDLMMTNYSFGGAYDEYGVDCFVEFYARFEPNEYTVSFDGNGAQGSMESLSCVYNKKYTLPDNTFTKEGYTFAGWQYGESVFDDAGTIVRLTTEDGGVATFTARWIKNFEGEGTEEKPYKISGYEQLKSVSDAVEHAQGYRAAHYELTADIDCEGGELYAIGYNKKFRGVFDGKGHVIKNAVFAATYGAWLEDWDMWETAYKGLFGSVFGGQIANLGLKDYVIDGTDDCAVIAPLVCSYTSDLPLQNCFAEGAISWKDSDGRFAGLVFYLYGRAVNCYSVCTFDMQYTHSTDSSAELYIGGFLGRVYGAGKYGDGETTCTVTQSLAENCYADAHINISVAPTVTKCYYHNTGLFSSYEGKYKNCFAAGEITYDCGYDFVLGIRSNVRLFCGNLYFNTCENIYVADSAKIVYTDKVITDVPESQKKTSIANLYSLEWLKNNMAFDETVWKENGEGLPTLA